MNPEPKKAAPDWEAVELDYRAGVMSLRELGTAHGVSHVAISKRAKARLWERDLSAKIRAKADSLVNRSMVTKEVTAGAAVTERAIIEANAERIAQVRGEHRSDIGRARALTVAMLVELESQTGNLPALVELGEILRSPNDVGADKLNDLYQAVLSLPERTKTVKALSEALKNLVGMEREAYNIGGNDPGSDRKPLTISDFYGDAGGQ